MKLVKRCISFLPFTASAIVTMIATVVKLLELWSPNSSINLSTSEPLELVFFFFLRRYHELGQLGYVSTSQIKPWQYIFGGINEYDTHTFRLFFAQKYHNYLVGGMDAVGFFIMALAVHITLFYNGNKKTEEFITQLMVAWKP